MVATQSQFKSNKPIDVSQLLRLGHIAANQGDRASAHRLLQQAAMLAPTDEQVWLALLQVVDTDADRYICLQNIVSLNPNNTQAKTQLERFEDIVSKPTTVKPAKENRFSAGRMVDWTLWVIEGLVILLLIGLAVVLVAYI